MQCYRETILTVNVTVAPISVSFDVLRRRLDTLCGNGRGFAPTMFNFNDSN
jgi:hypothetical protein